MFVNWIIIYFHLRIEKREIQKKRFEIEKKLRLVKKAEQNKNKEKTGSGKEKTDKKDKSNGGPVTVPADRKKTLEENKAGRSEKWVLFYIYFGN